MICEICKKQYSNFISLSGHIKKHKISLKSYYDIYLRKKDGIEGICLTCGEETNFSGLPGGYHKFCSRKCKSNNKENIEKTIKMCLSEPVLTKRRCTCQRKFGCDSWSKTSQGRLFLRINGIKQTEVQKLNNEPLCPCIGNEEREFLNTLQPFTIYNIIRNDPSFRYVIGRFPDGHIKELRLFIQFDERFHFLDEKCKIYKQNDLNCTLQLESLNYKVWRVSELEWIYNKEKVIEEFKYLIQKLTKEHIK